METRSRHRHRTRVGWLFRWASLWQKAVVVVCALAAAHGVGTMFIPHVQLPDSDMPCPQAIVAAFAGSGGTEIVEGPPELAERHDAACASVGRQWLLAAVLQAVIASVWGLSILEWAGARRRARREARGEARGGVGR